MVSHCPLSRTQPVAPAPAAQGGRLQDTVAPVPSMHLFALQNESRHIVDGGHVWTSTTPGMNPPALFCVLHVLPDTLQVPGAGVGSVQLGAPTLCDVPQVAVPLRHWQRPN